MYHLIHKIIYKITYIRLIKNKTNMKNGLLRFLVSALAIIPKSSRVKAASFVIKMINKTNLVAFLFFCSITNSVYAQWQQAAGTAGLNMQSLLTNGVYNLFLGDGATFSDNTAISTSQVFTGMSWALNSSNLVTFNVLNGSTFGNTGITNNTTIRSMTNTDLLNIRDEILGNMNQFL
jgi:hypothetical protein